VRRASGRAINLGSCAGIDILRVRRMINGPQATRQSLQISLNNMNICVCDTGDSHNNMSHAISDAISQRAKCTRAVEQAGQASDIPSSDRLSTAAIAARFISTAAG